MVRQPGFRILPMVLAAVVALAVVVASSTCSVRTKKRGSGNLPVLLYCSSRLQGPRTLALRRTYMYSNQLDLGSRLP